MALQQLWQKTKCLSLKKKICPDHGCFSSPFRKLNFIPVFTLCVLFFSLCSCCIFSGRLMVSKKHCRWKFPCRKLPACLIKTHTRVKWVPVVSCSGSKISSKKDNGISHEFYHFFCPSSINHCHVISWNKVRITPAA